MKNELTVEMIRKARKILQRHSPKPIIIDGKKYFLWHIPSQRLMGVDCLPLKYPPQFRTKKDGTPDKRYKRYKMCEEISKDMDAISGVNKELTRV